MTLRISRTPEVAVALNRRIGGHVQRRRSAVAELPVSNTHAGVKHEDRGASSRSAALVRPNPVQAPGSCLHVGLDLWDHVNLAVGLDVLGSTTTALKDRLQIALAPPQLDEGDTAVGMSDKIASFPVCLAHLLDLRITGARFQHHNPL